MSQARAVPLRQLPIELLSSILGPLDKPTLAACSLVARSWVYTARMYLFRSITYRVNAEIHYGVHQTPPPLHDLLYFLVTTPSVCSHIRDLCLMMDIPPAILLQLLSFRVAVALRGGGLDVLYAILRRTPGLQSLTVHDFRFADPGSALTLPPIADGPALQHLGSLCIRQHKLFPEEGREDHTSQLFYLVGSIGKLSYDSRFIGMHRFVDAVPAWPPAALKHVRELTTKNGAHVLHLHMIDYTRLEACHFRYNNGRADFSWLADWLRTTGRGLRHFGLPLRSHQRMLDEPASYFAALDLSVLERLESLSLVLTLHVDVAPGTGVVGLLDPVYAFLCRTLPAMPATLRSVALRLDVRDISNRPTSIANNTAFEARRALATDWQELDRAFVGRATTAGLQTVQFKEEMFEAWPAVRRAIEKALPAACEKGIVQWADACEARGTF